MPSGTRIRTDNVLGTVTDDPLTNVATTLNSAGLANLAAVSSAHAIIVLDPLRSAGAPEIVVVTAHTGSATSATVTRGQYGTAARQHASGVLWVHAATVDDLIRIATASGGRPSDPYEMQLLGRTDLDAFEFYNGTDWSPMQGGGTLGYAFTEADQLGIGSTITDLTELSATVTVAAGRSVRITGKGHFQQQTSTGTVQLFVREGSSALDEIDRAASLAAGGRYSAYSAYVFTPSAGAHTYKLSASTTAGAVDLDIGPGRNAYILVEDIGTD